MDDSEIGERVRQLVVAWLGWLRERDQRERARELMDRVEGYRVVDGGQTSRDGSWEITDAETGELLASGVGLETFDSAWLDSWVHVDAIARDAHGELDEPSDRFGLPPGMVSALTDWIVEHPDEGSEILK